LDQWWEVAEWYHFAENFLWRANQCPDRIVFLSRLPVIGLGLLLTSLVFRWTNMRFGPWGGLLAAAFCALDPNILAHERLSTTDLGGTFFTLLAAYAFWRLSQELSPWRVLAAGLALGLAFAAKLLTLTFGPILAFAFLIYGIRDSSQRLRHLVRRLGLVGAVAALALFVIWASYLFQVGHVEGLSFPVPAPPYVQGVQAILDVAGGGRPAYLLGEISTEGWWYYFPVAFAVKTPLPTLLGLLIANLIMILQPSRDDLFIWIPPLVFFLALTTARLNLGYRHLLPILPFLAIHIGRLARSSGSRSAAHQSMQPHLRRSISIVLTAWLALSTVLIYPHFLAYFNPVGGGPENGWRILVDSNIDWGQDLKELRKWMVHENVERVRLSWFGSAPPEAYGIDHELLVGVPYGFTMWRDPPFNPDQPEPGVYAISVTNLVGVVLPNPDLYAWFRRRPSDDRVGHSVFIYRVTAP
jgi:4-amino-4-deoxy-L-arabinose transferase-like glycosyltransferase